MNWSVEGLLSFHISVVSIVLVVFAWLLWIHGLFRWTTTGFWAWVAFLLYYVLNPYFALRENDIGRYIIHLSVAGGNARGIWVLVVAVLGMIFFFWAYLQTKTESVHWRLVDHRITAPMIFCAVPFVALGVFSLLTFRSSVLTSERQMVIEGGRFVGQVTGYENAGYMFLVVPILLFTLSQSRTLRVFGWLITGIFLLLALQSGWSRFMLVSVLLAVSLADVLRRQATWPRAYFVPILLLFTVALQLRGHVGWSLDTTSSELLDLSSQATEKSG